jgi:hypothetical protein
MDGRWTNCTHDWLEDEPDSIEIPASEAEEFEALEA